MGMYAIPVDRKDTGNQNNMFDLGVVLRAAAARCSSKNAPNASSLMALFGNRLSRQPALGI